MNKILCLVAILFSMESQASEISDQKRWIQETCEKYAEMWIDLSYEWERFSEWMNYSVDSGENVDYGASHDSREHSL